MWTRSDPSTRARLLHSEGIAPSTKSSADLIRVLEQETAATIAKREATFSDIDRRKNSINEHRMKLDDRKQIIEQSQSDLHDQRSKVFALQKGADDLRRGLEESKIASREKIVRYEKRLETSMIQIFSPPRGRRRPSKAC